MDKGLLPGQSLCSFMLRRLQCCSEPVHLQGGLCVCFVQVCIGRGVCKCCLCRCESKCVCCQYGAVLKVGQPSVCELWGGQCRHVRIPHAYRLYVYVWGVLLRSASMFWYVYLCMGAWGGRSVRVSEQGCDRKTACCAIAGWAGMHLLPAQCACVCTCSTWSWVWWHVWVSCM